MRAAALAVAVFGAFIAVMYLRFSGDAVPEQPPWPSSGANVGGNCFVFRVVGAPEPTPAPADAPPTRVPCSTVNPSEVRNSFGTQPEPTPPEALLGPVPDVLQGIDVQELEYGSETAFPQDLALIVETGCIQCDGPTTGLSRVHRDPAGAIRVETLVSAEKLGLPPRLITTAKGTEERDSELTAFAVKPDGTELIVAFCTRGLCGGSYFPFSVDTETTVFRSTDGGISWSELGRLPPGHFMRRGFLSEGRVVVSSYANGTETSYIFPSGEELSHPPDSGQYAWPRPLSNGSVLWQTGDGRVLREDGTVFLEAGGPYGDSVAGDILSDPGHTGSVLLTLSSKPENYLATLRPDGSVERAYSFSNFLLVGVWAQEGRLFGNAAVDPALLGGPPPSPFVNYLPAVIDLDTRTVHPIREPFFDPPLANGRNHVVAVQQGPFARVVNTEGTCLNIRGAPQAGAAVLGCAAEGVLLRLEGPTVDADGITWLAARPFGSVGPQGWVSAQYLER